MAVDIDTIRRAVDHSSSGSYTDQIAFRASSSLLAGFAQSTGLAAAAASTQLAQDGQTPFSDLLLAVFNSIFEVFILCAVGYILARQGILDKRTQKQINRLNVSLFTPALLFSKVAFFLTPAKLKELWVIPIWFVIVTTTSMVVGSVLGWLFGLRKSQKSFITAAAMFMNSNALPIALMQSLVVSVPDLAWGSDDNKNAMLGRALTYLTMYSTLGMVVRYSYGVSLLSRADTILAPRSTDPAPGPLGGHDNEERTPLLQGLDDEDDHENENDHEQLRTHASASTLVVSSSSKHFGHSNSGQLGVATPSTASSEYPSATNSPRLVGSPVALHALLPKDPTDDDVPVPISQTTGFLRPPVKRKNTAFYNSFPNSPNESRAELPRWEDEGSTDTDTGSESGSESDCDGRSDCECGGLSTGDGGPAAAATSRDLERGSTSVPHHHHRPHIKTKHHTTPLPHTLHHFLLSTHLFLTQTATTVNNFMTVPLWAALLSLFVASVDGVKHALEHHLQPVNEAVNMAGKCAVPVTLVVLGAYFYAEPEVKTEVKGLERETLESNNNGGKGKMSMSRKEERRMRRDERWRRRIVRNRTVGQRLMDLLPFFSSSSSSSASETAAQKQKKAREDKLKKKQQKQRNSKPGESKTVWLAVAARMVITPLLLIPVMVLATRGDWHAVFEDPIFVVVNTILLCSPPALTLAQITAAVSGDAFERLISRTIFWSYCVVTPIVMMGSVLVGLWLAKL